MLKNRVITASILAPLIILAIFIDNPFVFPVVWGVVISVCAWEWSDLAGLSSVKARAAFVAVCLGLIGSYQLWAMSVLDWLAWPVVAWWLLVSFAIRKMPAKILAIKYPVALKLLIGVFILVTSWMLMVWTQHNLRGMQTLYFFMLIWIADIAAYFVGKNYGFTKLSEAISPGKTVEGLYGALLAVALFSAAVAGVLYWTQSGTFTSFNILSLLDFVMLSVFTVLISVVGDLFESLIKRIRGVKDSGTLLPGHGGVLDRVDSLIAGVSVFYAGSQQLGIFFQ